MAFKCLARSGFVPYFFRIFRSKEIFIKENVFRCFSSLRKTAYSLDTKPHSLRNHANTTQVHPEITEILEKSRPKLVGNNWHKPKLSARRVAELRKKYIADGYYWPLRPLVDRKLDKTPKGHRYEREKERKLTEIEENMRMMPKMIEEYRNKMRGLRAKRKEEKKISTIKTLEAKRAGIHPKDPRAQGKQIKKQLKTKGR